jgi:NAD(P)H-quinone oxidoreductase subunit 5
VIAALVMTTRISIKVALAWSTCAQMGFMLVQCGLGLWEMALLHLLAHSLYKAHAFLGAGGVVRQTQRRQLARPPRAPNAADVACSGVLAVGATLAIGGLWGALPGTTSPSASLWVMTGIVGLALVPLLSRGPAGPRPAWIAGILAVPVAYFALHELLGRAVPPGPDAPIALLAFVALAFALLFVVHAVVAIAPDGRLSRGLYPWIYGGLFIDEAFTRLAFAIWKPPAPQPRVAPLPHRTAPAVCPSTTPDRSLV